MKRNAIFPVRVFLGLLSLMICLLILPETSLGAGSVTVESGSLKEAMEENPEADTFTVTGTVAACDIPAGITVEIAPGGKLTGASFYNAGRVIGAYSGLIYNEGDASQVTGATLRVPGPISSGTVTVLYYDDNTLWEEAVYHKNKLWILPDHKVSSAVMGKGFYWADNNAVGEAMTYTISYRIGDGTETPLMLDPAVYPASYQVMTVDQTIPAGPSVDGKPFGSWLCAGLTCGETLTIPAGTNQDLILYYQAQGEEKESDGLPGGSSGGGAGGADGFMGSFGGSRGTGSGSAGTGMGSAQVESQDEQEKTATAQAPSNIMNTAGGMRIRSANSTTRRVITNDGGQSLAIGQDVQKKRDFPWPWVGLGLGLGLLLALGIAALKTRAAAKTAAMYEKLNIR
ncbi:MAG: hypothetical protein IJF41_03495 [Clostridia bacterium]|nr:hypothetical protein [Clostridia bacterium]